MGMIGGLLLFVARGFGGQTCERVAVWDSMLWATIFLDAHLLNFAFEDCLGLLFGEDLSELAITECNDFLEFFKECSLTYLFYLFIAVRSLCVKPS